MSEGFDPNREFYKLANQNELAMLLDDVKSMIGEVWADYDNRANGDVLLDEIAQRFGQKISLSQFVDLWQRLRRTGRITTTERQEQDYERSAEPDARPRNLDGTFKSEFQIFCETKSASEIRSRASRDKAFGDYVRQQRIAEMTPTGDGIEQAVPLRQSQAEPHPALRKFALAYIASPSGSLRPIAGFVTLSNGERFTLQKFNSLIEEAAAARLI